MGLRISSQALALLLLVYSVETVAGLDWTQCFFDIKASANVTNNLVGLLDGNGYPVSNIADATAISYSLCTSACGSGRNFQWPVLSQDFSSWLLPYLALISQLPFGAHDRLDSVMSAVLTVGSPALAGYSLFITLLNSRWINHRFHQCRLTNPNLRFAVAIVSSLQQFPLEWHSNDVGSLTVFSESDCWWKYLYQLADNGQSWSAASATSIGWVVVAYVLSIANSPSDAFTSAQADGGVTGSMWLWLISIVVGWLLLSPKCDFKRLTTAYKHADQHARTGSTDGSIGTPTQRALTITARDDDVASSDELLTPPVFNYSRSLPWTHTAEAMFLAFQAAAQNQFPVNINSEAQPAPRPCSHWVPGVFTRMALASGASLALQWGTVGGAFIAEWFTPTTGMGCRSLSYLIYGAVSTVIWMMLLISSILAHYSKGHINQKSVFALVPLALSVCLRRMGKLLAIANSIWVILTCVLQYSDFYDTCFCNSSMISRGQAAYITIIETSAQAFLAKVAWYGALSLSLGSAGAFVILISLLLDTLPIDSSS
ncbi:hypothetical protein EDD22DRAFT_843540 [Suillus occidentalis]|nr:hypothetical protein EDD22DRAFT_843540 [Suillus occidentalis]